MSVIHTFHSFVQRIKQIPRRVWLFSAAGVLLLLYGIAFFVPKPVQFSYAGSTCVGQFFLLPDIQQQRTDSAFRVSLEGGVSIGSLKLLSTSTCFVPQKELGAGAQHVSVAPWGSLFFAKQFAVEVPSPPELANVAESAKHVSAARPLRLSLTAPDTVHAYEVSVADHTTVCTKERTSDALQCDMAQLQLEHGHEYVFTVSRTMANIEKTEKVTSFTATTLLPVEIVSTSVTNEQTVYDNITSVAFTTDKPLSGATATLVRLDGDTEVPVAIQTSVDKTDGRVTAEEPLARKATYVLRITQLDGAEGGSLAAPYEVRFSTSGGPKVASSSMGPNMLSTNQKIILTFDQPIDETTDLSAFIHVEGARAAIARQSESSVSITLQNAPLCAAINLAVDKGIKSGSNGEVSDEGWTSQSRIACGYATVIGYSVQGRPITAYYFGTGGTTILFTGGMHGSEPSGQVTMQAWATYLMANGYKIPADKRVVIVPNTNPDGIATGSRNNAHNVNIDRNFPTANWKADIETTNGILTNGGGTAPGSEPETATIMAFTRQLRPRLEVSFHAQGSVVGANKFSDSVAIGNTYAATVGYATMFYDAEAVMGYPMTGEYEDWMGEEMGIPAILIELPSQSGNYLQSQLNALMKMVLV